MLTDEQIAAIGSKTALRRLPDYLDSDRWNNVESDLLAFARAIESAARQAQREEDVRLLRQIKMLTLTGLEDEKPVADWLAAQPLVKP